MTCPYFANCGGCRCREKTFEEYCQYKCDKFAQIMSALPAPRQGFGKAVFIPDGTRRRASLAFLYRHERLTLGFNAAKSDKIIDVASCALLTDDLNAVLPELRKLLLSLCVTPFQIKSRGRQISAEFLKQGDVWLSQADNGIDIVLEFDKPLGLEHRSLIFEWMQKMPSVIRLSHRRRKDLPSEPVVEKAAPCLNIAGFDIPVPAGTFMQASKAAETALINLVLDYLAPVKGRIADLFCGMGTFSYPLSRNPENKILAADSSDELLTAFQAGINRNMISNIEVMNRNLFKYPLDAAELKGFDAVVFDPPRAGASAQVAVLAALSPEDRPHKVIAVSCNPNTFVRDAKALLAGGYAFEKAVLVDQFVYSDHMELVALFTPVVEEREP